MTEQRTEYDMEDLNGWLPLESAPKDGTLVQAYFPKQTHLSRKIGYVSWGRTLRTGEDGWFSEGGCWVDPNRFPIYWKPLQELPPEPLCEHYWLKYKVDIDQRWKEQEYQDIGAFDNYDHTSKWEEEDRREKEGAEYCMNCGELKEKEKLEVENNE